MIQNTQIPPKRRIPKIISGILATILLILLAWLLLPSFWFWVSFEIIASLLVAVGCGGEWWLHHHPAGRKKVEKDEHHKLESRYIAMVCIGVMMEFFALGHTIREGVELEKKVAQANERIVNTESNNLVLRSNVLALENKYGIISTNVEQLNPLQKPVRDASAVVRFRATNAVETNSLSQNVCARLFLNRPGHWSKFGVIELYSDRFRTNDTGEYSLDFKPDFRRGRLVLRDDPDKPVADITNGLDCVSLWISFLAPEFGITGGSIDVLLNEEIPLHFDIPGQRAFFHNQIVVWKRNNSFLPIPYHWLDDKGELKPFSLPILQGITNR